MTLHKLAIVVFLLAVGFGVATHVTAAPISPLSSVSGSVDMKILFLQNKVNELIVSNNQQEAQIATLNTQVATLNTQVANLTTQVTTLDNRVTTLEGQVTTLNGQVATLNTQVSTLQGQVGTLQGQVATLQGQVTTLDGQVSTLNGQVTTLNGQVSTLSTSLTNHVNDQGNAHNHDARYVRDSGANLRTLGGNVNSDGSIFNGSDFTASRTGVGTYVITFNQAFSTPPHAAFLDSSPSRVKSFTIGSTSLSISFFDGSGNPTDAAFSFLVLGPQ